MAYKSNFTGSSIDSLLTRTDNLDTELNNYLLKNGGTMTGVINMNGKQISGLNDPTETSQAARKGYVDASVRKAAPRNLLDNSDFTNLVAQAGIGGNHGSIAYAADRWILTSGTVSYTADTGLTLKGTITQKLENAPATAYPYIGMASGTASISYASGAVTITSSGGVIKWAALYEGEYTAETLPEYQPKGYAAELLECQRYYQVLTGLSCTTDPVCNGVMYYRFDIPMVNTPSLSPTEVRLDIYGIMQKDVTISADISTTQMWVFYNTGELPGRINRIGTPLTLTADL